MDSDSRDEPDAFKKTPADLRAEHPWSDHPHVTGWIQPPEGDGGLRQGAIELTPKQEAVLDLAVEQALAPVLRRVSESFVQVMLEQGVPIEAIVTELVLSGEVERTYRLVRLEGGAAQMAYHSPTSQYGQMSRSGRYNHLDIAATMRELVDDIASGRFADEWDGERDTGYARLEALRARAMAPEILAFEEELRTKLGERAVRA